MDLYLRCADNNLSVYTIYTVVYLVKNFKEIANKHLKEGSIKLKKSRSLKGN